ncbi:MAG: CPBP family intramembrane glutamic endopeptidase [Patescibacteria group bacterium]
MVQLDWPKILKPTPVSNLLAVIVQILSAFFIYLSSQFFGLLLFSAYLMLSEGSLANFETLANSIYGQFTISLMINGLVLAELRLALKWTRLRFNDIGWRAPTFRDAWLAAAGFTVYFLIYIFIYDFVNKYISQVDVGQKQQIGFESASQTSELALVFVSLVILPPIIEELLFRGYLYGGLRFIGKIKAAVIVSILFAAAHLQLGSGAPPLWIAAIDTGLLSLFLVYLREKSGGIMAPIGLHMIKNCLVFVSIFIVT